MIPYSILRFLPLTALSRLTGALSKCKIPYSLRKFIYISFSRIYGVNLNEVEKDLEAYQTFSDFFTRNLKESERSTGSGIISPVDGTLLEYGDIKDSFIFQAKGLYYTLEELFALGSHESLLGQKFKNGSFASFYLAPGDYHHIHSPVDGDLVERIYVPGALFPVGLSAVRSIPSLYCTNERVISILSSSSNLFAVIMIGATNVGNLSLSYEPDFSSINTKKVDLKKFNTSTSLKKAERLGTFYLGSSVILLSQKKISFAGSIYSKMKVKYGQSLSILEEVESK